MTFVKLKKPHVDVTVLGNKMGTQTPNRFCIHSTESHDTKGLSDVKGVLTYLRNTPDNLGVHFCIDAEGHLGQGGYSSWLMYGAAGANTNTLHCELIGMAKFTSIRWMWRHRQLEELSRLMAYAHYQFGIPLKWRVERGFFTHLMASRYYGSSDHWDPGYGFPKWRVMRRAQDICRNGGWETGDYR